MTKQLAVHDDSARLLSSVDWFGVSADPASYIPRPSTEEALRAAERGVEGAKGPVLLIGSAGVGKTLVLRVLGDRLRQPMLPVYLPIPTLPQGELCALTLGLLNRPAGPHPEEDLLIFASEQRARGRSIVLLIDDAGSMSTHTARGIAALAAASHGGLRLVLAVTDGPDACRLYDSVGPELGAIQVMDSMNAFETRRYIRNRIGREQGKHTARRVSRNLLDRIHRDSEGVPARVHEVSGLYGRS